MAASFPNLPGYVPTHDCTKTDWKKVSHIKLEEIHNPKNAPTPMYTLPQRTVLSPPPPKDPKSMSYSHTQFRNPYGDDIQVKYEPTFVKLDKQVLRYYAYFQEGVAESNVESHRIRKLTINYYLDDSTIGISEKRQNNSGIPQGDFLKRQMVLRSDGSGTRITPFDFVVGQDITIYGRTMHVYDCDPYTREFCANFQKPQPGAESCPTDAFGALPQKPTVAHDRDFAEHYLGGVRVHSQKQFLDNDRKVLRFYGFYGNVPIVIHYFLADDTIEVLEVHFSNDGCYPYPTLLKRQKMPKNVGGLHLPGQAPLVQEYYTAADFCPGKPWTAYSKVFDITGVDPYTQSYYEGNFNCKFPISTAQPVMPAEPPPMVIPPYNGFGTEEDSLGYVYRLDPKPPKTDFFKYVDNDKVVLRYTARLLTTVPEDVDRRFIISYYLADNTLSIYEPYKRNSGIAEGKFLERGRYKNATGLRKYIEPTDFAVGGDVGINAYSFQILSQDLFTEKWATEHIKA